MNYIFKYVILPFVITAAICLILIFIWLSGPPV